MRTIASERGSFHTENVVNSVDKRWAEERENALKHVLVAVVLFVIVGSTITLLVPDAITLLLHVGSATH